MEFKPHEVRPVRPVRHASTTRYVDAAQCSPSTAVQAGDRPKAVGSCAFRAAWPGSPSVVNVGSSCGHVAGRRSGRRPCLRPVRMAVSGTSTTSAVHEQVAFRDPGRWPEDLVGWTACSMHNARVVAPGSVCAIGTTARAGMPRSSSTWRTRPRTRVVPPPTSPFAHLGIAASTANGVLPACGGERAAPRDRGIGRAS